MHFRRDFLWHTEDDVKAGQVLLAFVQPNKEENIMYKFKFDMSINDADFAMELL